MFKSSVILLWFNLNLYNFSICSWDNPETLISTISGLLDVSPSPKTNSFYFWRHKDTSTNQAQTRNISETCDYYIKFRNFGNPKVCHFLKRWAPNNDEDPSTIFLKILDMRSISIEKHEMRIW